MVSVYTLSRVGTPEWEGRTRTVVFTMDVTDYENPGGVVLTLKELQMHRLIDLKVEATENAYVGKWNESLTAPTILLYGQEPTDATASVIALAELVDTTDAGTFRVTVKGR